MRIQTFKEMSTQKIFWKKRTFVGMKKGKHFAFGDGSIFLGFVSVLFYAFYSGKMKGKQQKREALKERQNQIFLYPH